MKMKGKKVSIYVGALAITLFGAGATMLIMHAASDVNKPEYAGVDPFSLDADFGQ